MDKKNVSECKGEVVMDRENVGESKEGMSMEREGVNEGKERILMNKGKADGGKEGILELVKRAKEGEEQATQALIEQYKPYIIKECSRFSIPSYDFEDLVQYSYLSILRAIKSYNFGKVHFTSYVMTAITNNLGDLLRKSVKIYREMQEEDGFSFDYEDNSCNVEKSIIDSEDMSDLKKALNILGKDEQVIIHDYYVKRMPLLAIAEENGYSYGGITKKKKRILKKLSSILHS